MNYDPWDTGRPWAFGIIRFTYLFSKSQNLPNLNSFVAGDTPLQHFFDFLAPASEAIRRHTIEMAQEGTVNVRADPLGEDDAVELAEQYRVERQTVGVAEPVVRSRTSTMIAAVKPISQVQPDHWHTKADKSTVTAGELEAIRERYQVPAEVELLLPTSTERASDHRPGEFTFYEEAFKGGVRLPLPQIVVDILNRLEVAPGQLMPNAWKIVLSCASAWPKANEGAAMTVDEFFACYKAAGQQETWVTLQAAMGRGLVAGLPTSIKGWRARWFYVSANGGLGARTIWKVPTKSLEVRLGAEAEERVKRVKEWRETENARWDDLVQPSALFQAGLGPQPSGEDLGRAELEARRKAQEAEDQAILAKATQFKKAQDDRPARPIAKERIRPRPKPLGGKDLSTFEPRRPPVDPVKEKARMEGEALKRKKKKRSVAEGGAEETEPKRMKQTPIVVETPAVKDTPEVVGVTPTVEAMEVAPAIQVEVGSTGAVPSGREQTQRGPAPEGRGVGLGAAVYHARAVAGRLEGEEIPARAGADRLVKIVEETALRSASGFNEADLFRGLCSAQMEVTTLAGALLRKAGAAKLKAEEAKAELAKLQKGSAEWKAAHTELPLVKSELEDTRRRVVSLEFQLAGEQKKLEESKQACAIAVERHEEAMNSNEDLVRQKDEADAKVEALRKLLEGERARVEEEKEGLRKELEAGRAKAAAEREVLQKELELERSRATAEMEVASAEKAILQKELDGERAKAASERAAYPDLYVAAVDQFKGSPEFQMAVDAAVAANLAREESGGAGPSRTTVGGRTESEVIAGFQQSDFYKHEMAEYWDSGWKMFKQKAEELFPELDLSSVTIGEDDVAQTPLDEGVEEGDLASSGEE